MWGREGGGVEGEKGFEVALEAAECSLGALWFIVGRSLCYLVHCAELVKLDVGGVNGDGQWTK